MTTTRIAGADDLARVLRELPPSLGRRSWGQGAVAGARVILKDARRRVRRGPEDTGLLRKALIAQGAKRPRKFAALAFVSVRAMKVPSARRRRTVTRGLFYTETAQGYDNPARYAHLVEFGAPGANVPAQPFLRPAVDANGRAAADVLLERAAREVEKVAQEIAGERKMRATTRRALARAGR